MSGEKDMARTPILIGFVLVMVILESNCGGGGGGTNITPSPPPSIVTTGLVDGMVTFPYNQTIRSSGGVAPLVWSVSSGTLPHNLNIATGTATITGTPDTAQTATFTIQVKDANNQAAAQTYTINIKSTGVAQLQPITGQAPAGTVEIQGVSAGPFNPGYWQENTLNWIPDVRMPMFAARTTGPYQNIYAPWPLEQPNGGWRMFYGGWDGQDVPFDQIYSTSTTDFLNFGIRDHIISNGAFLNVNNVNVQQLPDGSLHMICTGGQAGNIDNFTVYFSSPDGTTWNGIHEPYSAQLSDIININGYAGFSSGNFNGANVLLDDGGTWVLYFVDWNNPGNAYRATASVLPNFQFQAAAIATQHGINDLKKIPVNGATWYLMGLAYNAQSVWFSLSNDGTSFPPDKPLFNNVSALDLNIVAVGFVMKGNQLLGVVYGGTAVPKLDQNEIFGRWLQKKVVVTDSSGGQYTLQGGYGPDRQWFQVPASGSFQGMITVYDEDGVTPLARGSVNLTARNAYQLFLQ